MCGAVGPSDDESGGRRDVAGALHGSRFVDLPHVAPHVEACLAFLAGDAPVLVEVGFDHGRRLHSTARLNHDWRVLGLEVRRRRVDEARARAESSKSRSPFFRAWAVGENIQKYARKSFARKPSISKCSPRSPSGRPRKS